MGEFQRTRSKVWWSSDNLEEQEGWSGPPRVSSSSPSSSHKSQDSGFSDSEATGNHHAKSSPPLSLKDGCVCHDQEPRTDETPAPTVSEESPNIDCTSQLPVSKLREKFLNNLCAQPPEIQVEKEEEGQEPEKEETPRTPSPILPRVVVFHEKVRPGVDLNKTAPALLGGAFGKEENGRLLNQSLPVPIPAPRTPPVIKRAPPIPSPRRSLRNKTEPQPTAEASEQFGTPAHSSTPKAAPAAPSSTPSKRLVTPVRSPRAGAVLGKKHGRPVNLLNDFNRSWVHQESDSVQHWMGELAIMYEPECTTTLQSKSIAVDLRHQVAIMAAAATDTVRELQHSTRVISAEFAKLCQQLEYGIMDHVGPLVQSLVGLVKEFLKEHCPEKKNPEFIADENVLEESCDCLRQAASKHSPVQQELSTMVTDLGNKFTVIVDAIFIQHIHVLVNVVEEPSSDMALRSALSSLTTLGLEGPHLSELVALCGGVRALLSVCLDCRSSTIRTAALRALATICCVAKAIRQFEQAGGVEILSDILAEESRPEPEVSEAAAVLAQITAPWVEDNQSVQGLSEQLPSLVHSLTRLVSNTSSCETLLLGAAALANLTFMEPRTVWPLLEEGTAGKLLQAVKKRGPKVSVFLQEQAATLLANMAAVPESRPHLAEQRAVVALLCFLQIRHSPLQRAPEIAAAERVQQKSAIALSRLCSDPVVAAQVVELQGVNRLVRLCKEERERNHSDGVLVACLAALRKIAANCGTKIIEDLDAMELVEPRLLDSFLIYSSRQESYV